MREPYIENFLAIGELCVKAMQDLHALGGLRHPLVNMEEVAPLRTHIRDVARRADRDEIERETMELIQRLNEYLDIYCLNFVLDTQGHH